MLLDVIMNAKHPVNKLNDSAIFIHGKILSSSIVKNNYNFMMGDN
jgi:hypothetical protein